MGVGDEDVVAEAFPKSGALFQELGFELETGGANARRGINSYDVIELGFEKFAKMTDVPGPSANVVGLINLGGGLRHGGTLGVPVTLAMKAPKGSDAALFSFGYACECAEGFDGRFVLTLEEQSLGGFAVPGVGVVEEGH